MRLFTVALISALILIPAISLAASKAEENFTELTKEVLTELQKLRPVHATDMGIHDYDGSFTDYSRGSVKDYYDKIKNFVTRIYKYRSIKLPVDMNIDMQLLRGNGNIELLKLGKLEYHKTNPNIYIDDAINGIYYILIRDYAPMELRLPDIISRMNNLPRFLQDAQDNLNAPPPLWLDYAKKNITGAIEFYTTVTTELVGEFPARADEINEASGRALAALENFKTFLDTLAPGAPGSFAVGKEYFDYMLEWEHHLPFDSDSLLRMGESLFAEYKMRYDSLKEVIKANPAAADNIFTPASFCRDDVFDYYNWEINQVRNYCSEHGIVSIDEKVGPCLAVETPEFLRGIIPGIAYMPAGPFDNSTTAYFYVQPLPDPLPDSTRIRLYKLVHNRGFKGSVVHEAFPGHHLQLQLAARNPSAVRRWQIENCFVEGWALYCEEMAYRQGLYGDSLNSYLSVLRGVSFRAARIIIDVKLQTGQFTYDQAVQFLVDNFGDYEDYFKGEVLRYSMDPTQPMSYLVGKTQIMNLRRKFKARQGDAFNLKTFHDRLLSEGSIPVSFIARKMLN